MAKISCLRRNYGAETIDVPAGNGSVDMEAEYAGRDRPPPPPDHLVVMVNGIIGSSQDWKFAAKQFLKNHPQDVIVHCSESNYSILTFDGVDVLGNRLADEVLSVIERHPHLRKISFVSHSLGGLVSRYAIAILYGKPVSWKGSLQNGECEKDKAQDQSPKDKPEEKIAGLEPVNFITSATPHLGSRGHKQAPALCGLYNLENFAAHASKLLGRTGNHLFLRDGDKEKPPLLLQMVKDSDELPFISALQSFKRRVAYANARYDLFVGWSTSSLRRRSELPKPRDLSRSVVYPHIINVETAKNESIHGCNELEAHRNKYKTRDMEEAMIRALTKMTWERVDVDFKGSIQRLFAHSTIQVKNYFMNSDGVDVIQHMIDNFWL